MKMQALTPGDYRRKRWLLGDYIDQAANRCDYETTVKDIEAAIYTGEYIPVEIQHKEKTIGLFVVSLAKDILFVVTLSATFPKGKDWRPEIMAVLVSIAKSQNRRIIEMRGRKGWTKYLKKLGFIKHGDYLRCEYGHT